MSISNLNVKKLDEINDLLSQVSTELYTKPQTLLSGSSIGQHVRHTLEFYICLEKSLPNKTVCYDDRERNLILENNIELTKDTIAQIKSYLGTINKDVGLSLIANYANDSEEATPISSSLFRELAYTLDHTIHHLAIIKIALKGEDSVVLDKSFGVAPSTIRYQEKCAQ